MAMKMTKSSTSAMKIDQERYQQSLREVRQGNYTVVTSDEEISEYLEALTKNEDNSSLYSNSK